MSDENDPYTASSMENPEVPEPPEVSSGFPTVPEMAALLPHFEFHNVLGVGGMGAVYLARQLTLDRWVAIKLLPASLSQDQGEAARFITEARSMAKLAHPHITAVHDFGQTSQGHFYLVMEYIDGLDLHRLIHRGEVTPDRVRKLVPQICDALQYSHTHGVVHRDIKPANILVTADWQVKIVDFGLARDRNDESTSEAEYGTPDYVAPERLQPDAAVDHRADIYALGVVIHEMFTMKTPQAAGAEAGRNLPPEFAGVVSRCMMHDPSRRFQSCAEIKTFLASATAVATAPVPSPAAAPVHRPVPPRLQARVGPKTHAPAEPAGNPAPWLWAMACVVLVSLGGWFIQNRRSSASVVTEASAPVETKADEPATNADPAMPVAGPQEVEPGFAAATASATPVVTPLSAGAELVVTKRLKGHADAVFTNAILPDQRRAMTGGRDSTIRVWDVESGRQLQSYASPVSSVSGIAVRDGKALIWSTLSRQAAVMDVETGKSTALTRSPADRLSGAAWSADGKSVYLMAGTIDGGVYHWDPSTTTLPQKLDAWPRAANSVFPLPPDKSDASGAGRLLVIGGTMKLNPNPPPGVSQPALMYDTGRAGLLSTPDHRLLNEISDYRTYRSKLELSPDATAVVSGMGIVSVLDLPSLTSRLVLESPAQSTFGQSAAWDRTGRLLVVGYSNGLLRLCEADTGAVLASADLGVRVVHTSVSRDNQWLLCSAISLDLKSPKPDDSDVLVIRMPALEKLGTDRGVVTFARRHVHRLSELDAELAALRDQALGKNSVVDDDVLRTHVRDLTSKYGVALRRLAYAAPASVQAAMILEADAVAKGMAVPGEHTDATTSGEHHRLRGIYRQQLAQLATARQQQADEARGKLEDAVGKLATQRQQAGNRVGEAMCQALLGSVKKWKSFNAVIESAFVPLAALPVTPAKPLASSTSAVPPAQPPSRPPTVSPPASVPPTVASVPKIPFARGVRTEVMISRPTKTTSYDDKTQVIKPRIKLTNTGAQAYEKHKAVFALIAESASQRGFYKVLLRHEFDITLPPRQVMESEGKTAITQYDRDASNGYTFGYMYDGWVLQIKDEAGNVVFTKSTSPTLEKMVEVISTLKADQVYDKRWNPVDRTPF